MNYNPFSKKNRKFVLLNLLSTTIWYSFAYIIKILLQTIKGYTMPTYIIHIGFVLIILTINIWAGMFWRQRKNKNTEKLVLDKGAGNAEKSITNGLSLEIDHNLKLLHEFWNEIWGELETSPITLAQAFNKSQQVVAETPFSEKIHAIRKDYYLTEVPSWHHKIFNSTDFFHGLSEEKQQAVKQFYDNLSTITSTHENLKTSNGIIIIREIGNNLKNIIDEVLERGNPLKTHNKSLEPTEKAGSLS